jgi:hypothetical protein
MIYCVNIEDVDLKSQHLLNWASTIAGKNEPRYWLIDTQLIFNNRGSDAQANLLLGVLNHARMLGFSTIMNKKQGVDNRRESDESPQGDTPQVQGQPSNPDNSGGIPEEEPRA